MPPCTWPHMDYVTVTARPAKEASSGMPTDTIRGSPYEKGLYFVGGTYGTAQWQVGTRYTLEKVLGHGGFSSVCLANDHQTGEKVALKRIPDVLSSPENAKRVLREVCILRRVTHPNIIGIRDCFVRPSATGQCRLVNGKLVNISIDVYIAMEFAEGGDLFHLKGQMSADEVKSIMWQLTYCIKYLHDLHVWHRDLKSQNVFVSWEGGQLVAKLGDFGSARSAIPEGYSFIDPRPPSSQTLPADAPLHSCPSYDEMHRETRHQDIYLRYEDSACGKRSGFKAPLTRVVATPCYRAPEVVMSRGGYSAAIDVWGLGCILGELLQRVAHVGSAATPHLQVAPLFAIHDMPKTPTDGDQYIGGPGNQTTRIELQALFDVIGTPAWADVAAVELPAWRNYLHRLPGRAPTLYRRFGAAGEVAIDLLKRMLSFDPWRRCTADEVLAHEYFGDFMSEDSGSLDEALVAVNGGPQQQQQQQQRRGSKALLHSTSEQSVVSEGAPAAQASPPMIIPIPPAAAAAAATAAAAAAAAGGGSVGAPGLASYRSRSIGAMSPPARLPPLPPHHNAQRRAGSIGLPSPPVVAAAAAAAAVQAAQAAGGGAGLGDGGGGIAPAVLSPRAGSMGALAQQALQQQAQQPQDVSLAAEEAGAAAGAGDVAMSDVSPFQQPAAQQQQQQAPEHSQHAKRAQQGEEERIRHYWEEKDPARALGMLEDEMATITAVTPGSEGCQKLRALLELECEAIAASHGGSFAPAAAHSVKRRFKLPVPEAGVLSGLFQKAGPGLQLDTAGDIFDPSDYGAHRLSNVADTWQVELDPEKYLGPQRHGEWTAFSGAGPPPGPRWGVTATPPGMDEASMDPRMAAVIKAQQLR